MTVLLIQGCSHKTTISEAQTRILVDAQIVKLDTFKQQLVAMKADLTNVPKYAVLVNELPEGGLKELTAFLDSNDCNKDLDFKACYSITRFKLIDTSYKLDNANDSLYADTQVINNLINNIDSIIDSFDALKFKL